MCAKPCTLTYASSFPAFRTRLADTINNLEEDNMALRGKLVELDMACSKVQDENLHLAQEAKGRYEEGRLFAETSLRRQIDSSHHQLKVMAEQNTVRGWF